MVSHNVQLRCTTPHYICLHTTPPASPRGAALKVQPLRTGQHTDYCSHISGKLMLHLLSSRSFLTHMPTFGSGVIRCRYLVSWRGSGSPARPPSLPSFCSWLLHRERCTVMATKMLQALTCVLSSRSPLFLPLQDL